MNRRKLKLSTRAWRTHKAMRILKTAGNIGYIRHFGQRKKGGIEEALDFRSENGWFIGREEEMNIHEKKILARQLGNSRTRGI